MAEMGHVGSVAGLVNTCRLQRTYPAAAFTTTLRRADHFVGTRAFSSSNQLTTT